jgi:hypothetical protein
MFRRHFRASASLAADSAIISLPSARLRSRRPELRLSTECLPGPPDIASTGLETSDLIALLMKLIYTERLETVRQFKNAIKLPYHLVLDLVRMAVDNKMLRNLGAGLSDSPIDSWLCIHRGRAAVHAGCAGAACATRAPRRSRWTISRSPGMPAAAHKRIGHRGGHHHRPSATWWSRRTCLSSAGRR